MESTSVHNKDGTTVGPVNDLEVIVEERETKNDVGYLPQVAEVGNEEMNDDKDPLGIADVSSKESEIHVDVITDNYPGNQVKSDDSKENGCITTLSVQEENGSGKDAVSEITIKDTENTENQQAGDSAIRQELVEIDDIQAQPFNPLELNNSSPSSSSSSCDNETNTLSNLEGFTPIADLNFGN